MSVEAEVEIEEEVVTKTYEFDEDFQRKLTALVLRDTSFNAKTEGLIRPEYFSSHIDGVIVRLVRDYYEKFKFVPSSGIYKALIAEGLKTKLIRKDDLPDLVARLGDLVAEDLKDAEFVIENVNDFARRMAFEEAIYKAAEDIDKNRYDRVEDLLKKALNVGINEETNRYDYWANNDSRAEHRREIAAGHIKPTGITTGHVDFDNLLYHKGWGRKELSLLMGPAKSGKSMALLGFAIAASLAGYNVAYVTLEVAAAIMADRADALISKTKIKDLPSSIGVVKSHVEAKRAGAGLLDFFDFPTGTLSPADLRRLLNKKLSQGVKYDLVVVDYADLMRPNHHSTETRENSRTIYVDLRAIAQELDLALLTATQTNREGFKAVSGRMEHVSEDINKARTVDILISLNMTEDERRNKEARLCFAASRNQDSSMTVVVRTDLERGTYIASVKETEYAP